MPSSEGISNLYQSSSLQFPSNEQFFFRFIIIADHHRFSQLLLESISHAISTISDSIPSDFESQFNDSNNSCSRLLVDATETFTTRILKLKLLGKFLGFILFWHQWTLTINREGIDKGPLQLLAHENSRHRNPLNFVFPFHSIIMKSLHCGSLTVSVPWIIQSLRMAAWDSTGTALHPYLNVLKLLRSIQFDTKFSLLNPGISSNRLYSIAQLMLT